MKLRKRIAALMMAGAMICSTLPVNAWAVERTDTGGLCEHHPQHTAECGYTEGTEGTPCTHEHNEDCYTLVTECVHEHTEDCYPAESESDSTATPSDADTDEPTECSHECSEENGCIKKELDCQHEHDSECGYAPAEPGQPCTFVCEICNAQEGDEPEDKPQPDEGECICAELCTADAVNADCPVCGAEDADLNACKGQPIQEEAECICKTLCTADAVNADCPVCGAEGADLAACEGQPVQEETKCICAVPCTEDAINKDCPVCGSENADLAKCEGKEVGEQVKAVQAQIDALPSLEDIQAMSPEEQQKAHEKVQAAYDAYNALTDEQKAQITGAEIFESLFAFFNGLTNTVETLNDVEYLDENGEKQTADNVAVIDNQTAEWSGGWYVVNNNVTIGTKETTQPVTITGDVHLILANGCNLTVNGGIHVDKGQSFTVYAQSSVEDTMGKLTTTGTGCRAGIGGGGDGDSSTYSNSWGTIQINGGEIVATGGEGCAGIGGGSRGSKDTTEPGTIIINGGKVTATGNNWGGNRAAAGIGAGDTGTSGGNITINGGTVIATGSSNGGAGIGGGYAGSGGMITINGGMVTANGGGNGDSIGGGAGIGGGSGGTGGTIIITGGVVNATGGEGCVNGNSWWGGAGIGGGGADGKPGDGGVITISGGMVTATGGKKGAGIGGGGNRLNNGGSGGTITISGGTVNATGGSDGWNSGAGIGGGKSGSKGTFKTEENGTAFITATPKISDTTNQGNWSGIIFEGNNGQVYGNQELREDLTLTDKQTLVIGDDSKLTIPDGKTLTNNGKITGSGTIDGSGKIDGNGAIGDVTIEGVTIGDDLQYQHPSNVTVSFSIADNTAEYDSTITITATIAQNVTQTTRAGVAANTVEFSVNGQSLGTAQVSGNIATLTGVTLSTDNGWQIGNNTVTAEFGGSDDLKKATGTNTFIVTAIKLQTPGNLQWDSTTPGKATWNAVNNASGYSVQLYKDGTAHGDAVSVIGTEEHTFDNISEAGSYTFKVKATSSADIYTDSNEAESGKLFTVSFDTDGAGTVDMQLVADGGKVKEPDSLTKTGYTFMGWYSDGSFTESNKWDFSSKTVSNTLTLYAKWETNTYSVTLNKNGGAINSGDITNYTYGVGAVLPTADDMTYTGHTFKGWYGNSSFSGSPITEISKTETGDKEYWAKWEANTYSITLDANDGTINSGDVKSYTYGEGATLPTDVSKKGYAFAGWYQNRDCSGSPVTEISKTDTGNKMFFAKWVSTDAGVTAVSVNEKAGTIDGTTITVVLDCGTAALPTASSAVSITAATGATVSDLKTADNGKTWTFTVTAEDGETKENYTIKVSIAPDPAIGNREDVNAAKSTIENHDWTVPQATANTGETVKAWIEGQLAAMNLNGASYTVTDSNFTAATEGGEADRDGTNGSFAFTVKLSKGENTGNVATSTYAEATVTIPGGTITATPYTKWTVTVSVEGAGTASGGGTFESGSTVTVTATPNGSRDYFIRWTENGAEVSRDAAYSFILTADRNLIAEFGTRSSGGDGGSSGGGSSSHNYSTIIDRPDKDNPQSPTTGQTTPVKPGTNGNTSIDGNAVQDAIDKATADAKKNGNTANGIAVTVPVQNAADAKSLSITIKAQTLDKLVTAKVRRFEITTNGLPSFGFTLDTLKMLNNQSKGGDLILRISEAAVTSAEAKTAIGTRPAYEISLAYVKDGKETPLTDWQGKTVSVKLPYTPAANEQAGNLHAVSVDGNGKVQWLTKSSYDADQKAVIFEAQHFGIYGVGYKTSVPAFTDINGHWAKEHILFTVGRGLFSGTSETTFSPNTTLTRGMFVTALGRLAGINPADYQTGTFTDVKADAYYAPYVNWAAKTGIVDGTTSTTFAPDSNITREQMAVIMKNYADKMGYSIPKTLEAVTFADNAQISSWAKDAVKAMQQAGVLSGKENNQFDPKGNATRAEAATVLHRFVEVIIDPQTANGWTQNDSGEWSYYKDGKPVKGWLSDDQKWYWLDKTTGKMFSGGWKHISGKWYYFYADGSMAANTTVDGYKVGANGERITQ